MQVIDRNTFREIVAQEGKFLRKKGSDTYIKRGILLPNELESDYEEVERPSPELEEAINKKKEEIEAYDISSAVNEFYLNGKPMWLPKETRVGLVNSINIEKAAKKITTNLWFDGMEYNLPIDNALQMLAALELYALECYNVTHKHLAAVEKLKSVEEVNAYDHTVGYPAKLNL